MQHYDAIIERLNDMRSKNLEPGAIVMGKNRLGKLEEEIGASAIMLDRSTQEFIDGSAVANLAGTKIYLDPVNDDKCYVIPQRVLEDMAKEYYNNE